MKALEPVVVYKILHMQQKKKSSRLVVLLTDVTKYRDFFFTVCTLKKKKKIRKKRILSFIFPYGGTLYCIIQQTEINIHISTE